MSPTPFHQRVVAGVEVEAYTILIPGYRISRERAFPRKGTVEKGERFVRDWSIGTEYNSRPFQTIREGLFLLKAGLRKYSHQLYRRKTRSRKRKQLLLVGAWRDRFAGSHVHMSIAKEKLCDSDANHWAGHLHDHLPLLIAISANSPVRGEEITDVASNRILRASKAYFHPIRSGQLTSRDFDEMVYSLPRKTKPATLEVRVMDSNIPEFTLAVVCLLKAISLRWLRGRRAPNRISHIAYLRSRIDAAKRGMRSRLCWRGTWLDAPDYLDRFVWTYREELKEIDIPQEIWTTFKLLKKGMNGARILELAVRRAYEEHPQSWQRRFAKRYVHAVESILAGNSILDFITRLGVDAPQLDDVWLGRRRLRLL